MIFHAMIFFRGLLNDDDDYDYDWSNKLVKLRKDLLKSLRTDKRRMTYGCNMDHSNDERFPTNDCKNTDGQFIIFKNRLRVDTPMFNNDGIRIIAHEYEYPYKKDMIAFFHLTCLIF